MANDLPQELCNDIVRFCKYDRKTLFQLCLTSIRFVNEAQTYLYAHLTRNTTSLNFARSSKLLSTLTVHNPSLAKYVKAFGYDIRLRKDNPHCEPHEVEKLQLKTRIAFICIYYPSSSSTSKGEPKAGSMYTF
ncbi:hypothetical protein AGABI1DRAFT_130242 [Agaricus bisporus var. burnettii JB137-S8]|uniref:F-box domain-containing protein n=1 Tax=Agaricus bisporus var. burnettii (strain JB137-S8 / ATCC MYA-4627 / FGSC 10392) TaxID=597362 RepID=K5WQC2_AGABU|nr:uncharacterized protein AGABI1DRAFT_130242 [Agaricus bisporus var. burnettii JB137-S8]EKM77546.1 hypothetical protein AGABI1DRAFT_130242 [Agaricus bisporus var. burnettii JB137-S8]